MTIMHHKNTKTHLLIFGLGALIFAIVVVCLVVTKITNLQNKPPIESTKNNQLDSSDLYLYQYKSKHFSADLGSKDVPNQPVVNFATNNSAIKYFPTGIDYASVSQEKLKEDSVTYHNVWPGISFNYTFTEKAIKEDIWVDSYKNLKIYKANHGDLSFEFKVTPQNALLRKQIIKGIEYYYFVDAATGGYRFRFEPPFMMDANGRRSNNVSLSVREIESLEKNTPQDEYTFLLTPDEKWLEKAIYPVRIDPTASVIDLYDDTTKIDTGNSSGYIVTGGQAKINLVAWYNSGGVYWDYREPITYDNSGGGAKSNYDVLVVTDTKALVDATKLQSDCDDLRFTDTDATTLVTYWIESGCNTTSTQIWVRIPDIAASTSETYYMYYGNSGASVGQQSYSGKMILMFSVNEASLPAGWTAVAAFNTSNRFPIGSSSYGATADSANHNHTFSGTSGDYASICYTWKKAGDTAQTYLNQHTHAFSNTVGNSNPSPPYVNIVYADNSTFPSSLPASSILPFTVDSASLPAGWSSVVDLNGTTDTDKRFPRGSTTYGTTGGSPTHTHTFSGTMGGKTVTQGSWTVYAAADGLAYVPAWPGVGHTHPYSFTSGAGSSLPTYLDVAFGTNATQQSFPASSVFLFTGTPPMGWTRFSALDSKFPRGSTTYGGSSATTTHDHSYSGNTTANLSGANIHVTNASLGLGAVCAVNCNAAGHWHAFSGTTSSDAASFSSVETIFATRNSTAVATTVGSETNSPKTATIQSTNLLSGISLVTSLTSFSYSISTIPTGSSATIQFSPDASTWYNGACSSGSRESMSEGSNTITLSGGCWSTSVFYYKLALSGTGGNTPVVDDITLNYVYVSPPTWCTLEKGPGNDQIIINWDDPNSSETSYQIDKNTNGSWAATPYYDTTVANIVTYTDSTSISAGNTYAYRVRAKLDASYSDWCYTVALTLGSGAFKFEGLKMEGVKID